MIGYVFYKFRGRGESTSPDTGYDWHHHGDDLSEVINKLGIDTAIFICFSKGVSYTLGYLEKKYE